MHRELNTIWACKIVIYEIFSLLESYDTLTIDFMVLTRVLMSMVRTLCTLIRWLLCNVNKVFFLSLVWVEKFWKNSWLFAVFEWKSVNFFKIFQLKLRIRRSGKSFVHVKYIRVTESMCRECTYCTLKKLFFFYAADSCAFCIESTMSTYIITLYERTNQPCKIIKYVNLITNMQG